MSTGALRRELTRPNTSGWQIWTSQSGATFSPLLASFVPSGGQRSPRPHKGALASLGQPSVSAAADDLFAQLDVVGLTIAPATKQSRAPRGGLGLRPRPGTSVRLNMDSGATASDEQQGSQRRGSAPTSLATSVSKGRGAAPTRRPSADARQSQHLRLDSRSGEGVEPSSAIRRAPPVLKTGRVTGPGPLQVLHRHDDSAGFAFD
jgi:hypothetical protein